MLTKDFYFDLPPELIAQKPAERRGGDRLMRLDRSTGEVGHFVMDELPNLIAPGTLMLFNDSRVRRARVYAVKVSTGAKAQFMFLNQEDSEGRIWRVMAKNAKRHKAGSRYEFSDGSQGEILDIPADEGTEFRSIRFDLPIDEAWFEKNGHIPLPPYIRREDNAEDSERYQNVYAARTGSAACPTAGLHFTREMLARLEDAGIQTGYVTLHVGLGTFLPVRAENLEEHKMHSEVFTIGSGVAQMVADAKREGRPVLAVGTTTVRALESAASPDGIVRAGTESTRIFMYPGYKFRVVDQMFTNFHTPESTLLMLVSAFAGRERILAAYAEAVRQGYRFFSYGDAMLIQ